LIAWLELSPQAPEPFDIASGVPNCIPNLFVPHDKNEVLGIWCCQWKDRSKFDHMVRGNDQSMAKVLNC